MFVLITYDVNTESPEGRRRLRRVAKICMNYGTRVQNSVFECVVDSFQLMEMKAKIGEIVDPSVDSIRYYNLGKHGRKHVDHVGAKPGLNVEGELIL